MRKKISISIESNKIENQPIVSPLWFLSYPQFSFPFLDDFPSPGTSLAHSFSSLFSVRLSPLRLSLSLSFIFLLLFLYFSFSCTRCVCPRRVTTPLERAARKIFLRRDSHFSRLTVVEGREITVAHLYGIRSLPARRALPRSLSRWVAEE